MSNPIPIMIELSLMRRAWGMSVDDVDELIGVTGNWVSKAESGNGRPSIEMLKLWADVLGFDLVLYQRP